MLRIENAIRDVLDVAAAPHVVFDSARYALFWTTHSKEKASDVDFSVAQQQVLDALTAIQNANKATVAEEYFCIRNFVQGWFAVLHKNKENRRIRVVTYHSKMLWPKEGDVVYEISETDIRVRIWI